MGWFEFWQFEGQPTTATTPDGLGNSGDLSAVELRELAPDGLAAVEWLDSHQEASA